MTKLAALATPLVAAALLAAGCGGNDGGESGGGGAKPSGSGTSAPTVAMQDIKFVPERVTVKRGGTMTWVNRDAISHTVTKESGPGPRFDSGTVAGGKTYRMTYATAGAIGYVCTIHPNQRGTITVE